MKNFQSKWLLMALAFCMIGNAAYAMSPASSQNTPAAAAKPDSPSAPPSEVPADRITTTAEARTGSEKSPLLQQGPHRQDRDARHCLELANDRAIHVCAERYRYKKR